MLDPEPVSDSAVVADNALIEHLAGQNLVLVYTNDVHDGTQG